MTDEDLLIRAQRAREALENPVLIEALEHYEQELTNAWKKSPQRDAEGRERLHQMLTAQRAFREYLEATLSSGKLVRVTQASKPQL